MLKKNTTYIFINFLNTLYLNVHFNNMLYFFMIFYHSNDFIIILLRTNNLIIKKYITYNFMFILLPSYNYIYFKKFTGIGGFVFFCVCDFLKYCHIKNIESKLIIFTHKFKLNIFDIHIMIKFIKKKYFFLL